MYVCIVFFYVHTTYEWLGFKCLHINKKKHLCYTYTIHTLKKNIFLIILPIEAATGQGNTWDPHNDAKITIPKTNHYFNIDYYVFCATILSETYLFILKLMVRSIM